MEIIARIQSDFPTKFAIPRQSGILFDLESKIIFEPKYSNADYIRGIEDFSHLWLLWCFSENEGKGSSPTVRPPRLGGNRRVGVFATRSPFRPNPIGLSSVELVRIEQTKNGPVLIVKGADLMDGTPIYDIKPYLPFTDSHPEAKGGFSDEKFDYALAVECPESELVKIPEEKRAALFEILRQDPRPSYQDDSERIYGFSFAGFEIRFRVEEQTAIVISVVKI
ncbi:MAG: tRNA (N6-threonylcarbamoyladenosine(37)-N6)-methyltransferase TrmO [Clostridia bacterium]|nr:tRNA (N6-threonylcarbamoyladenosine(37)-N6)-methyltransferase TrmO [Clostridia bacterium]